MTTNTITQVARLSEFGGGFTGKQRYRVVVAERISKSPCKSILQVDPILDGDRLGKSHSLDEGGTLRRRSPRSAAWYRLGLPVIRPSAKTTKFALSSVPSACSSRTITEQHRTRWTFQMPLAELSPREAHELTVELFGFDPWDRLEEDKLRFRRRRPHFPSHHLRPWSFAACPMDLAPAPTREPCAA